LGTAPEPGLAGQILAAEQRFRDLSAIAQAEQSGLAASRNEPLRRRMLILQGCEQWVRELGQIALLSPTVDDPALARAIRETIGRIDTTLPAVISRLADQSAALPIADE